MNRGFTLLELAVVITIIAVLFGSIFAGATLVRQAEMRSIISELELYKNAYKTFLGRYLLPPGNVTNADSIWAGNCAITITCNGNGNYSIDAFFGSNANETARAWKHLERAELINYNIAPVPASYTGRLNFDIAPKSKTGPYGYYMAAGFDIGGDSSAITSPFNSINSITNGLFFGGQSASGGFTVGALTPKEAYGIDKKIDDGFVNAGALGAGNASGIIRVVQDQNGGSSCISGGNYNLTSTSRTCLLGYQLD